MTLSRGLWNGQEFDLAQVRALFFSGEKPDPENPGKSGFEIPANFGQILGTIHRKESIYEVIKKYFEIFIKLNIFDFEIFKTKCTNSKKIPPDLHFP